MEAVKLSLDSRRLDADPSSGSANEAAHDIDSGRDLGGAVRGHQTISSLSTADEVRSHVYHALEENKLLLEIIDRLLHASSMADPVPEERAMAAIALAEAGAAPTTDHSGERGRELQFALESKRQILTDASGVLRTVLTSLNLALAEEQMLHAGALALLRARGWHALAQAARTEGEPEFAYHIDYAFGGSAHGFGAKHTLPLRRRAGATADSGPSRGSGTLHPGVDFDSARHVHGDETWEIWENQPRVVASHELELEIAQRTLFNNEANQRARQGTINVASRQTSILRPHARPGRSRRERQKSSLLAGLMLRKEQQTSLNPGNRRVRGEGQDSSGGFSSSVRGIALLSGVQDALDAFGNSARALGCDFEARLPMEYAPGQPGIRVVAFGSGETVFFFRTPDQVFCDFHADGNETRITTPIADVPAQLLDIVMAHVRRFFLRLVMGEAERLGCGENWEVDDVEATAATASLQIGGSQHLLSVRITPNLRPFVTSFAFARRSGPSTGSFGAPLPEQEVLFVYPDGARPFRERVPVTDHIRCTLYGLMQ